MLLLLVRACTAGCEFFMSILNYVIEEQKGYVLISEADHFRVTEIMPNSPSVNTTKQHPSQN